MTFHLETLHTGISLKPTGERKGEKGREKGCVKTLVCVMVCLPVVARDAASVVWLPVCPWACVNSKPSTA